MFASSSSRSQKPNTKPGILKNANTITSLSARSATLRKPTQPNVTSSPNSNRTPRTGVFGGSSNGRVLGTSSSNRKPTTSSAPVSKCKFTEKKPLAPKQTRSLALERPKSSSVSSRLNTMKNLSMPQERKKITTVTASAQPQSTVQPTAIAGTRTRIWNRPTVKTAQKKLPESPRAKSVEKPCKQEMGIQTNEMEILNSDLIIGDVKFLLPSQMLIYQIDQERNEARKRELLKARRKFQEHDKKEEEHLTDLQEFLEKAVITRRTRNQTQDPHDALAMDRKLIKSMDELLNRNVPKTESITDIKGRIKKKEKELLTLFETIENFRISNV